MKKKVVALLLSGVLALGLAGCGEDAGLFGQKPGQTTRDTDNGNTAGGDVTADPVGTKDNNGNDDITVLPDDPVAKDNDYSLDELSSMYADFDLSAELEKWFGNYSAEIWNSETDFKQYYYDDGNVSSYSLYEKSASKEQGYSLLSKDGRQYLTIWTDGNEENYVFDDENGEYLSYFSSLKTDKMGTEGADITCIDKDGDIIVLSAELSDGSAYEIKYDINSEMVQSVQVVDNGRYIAGINIGDKDEYGLISECDNPYEVTESEAMDYIYFALLNSGMIEDNGYGDIDEPDSVATIAGWDYVGETYMFNEDICIYFPSGFTYNSYDGTNILLTRDDGSVISIYAGKSPIKTSKDSIYSDYRDAVESFYSIPASSWTDTTSECGIEFGYGDGTYSGYPVRCCLYTDGSQILYSEFITMSNDIDTIFELYDWVVLN